MQFAHADKNSSIETSSVVSRGASTAVSSCNERFETAGQNALFDTLLQTETFPLPGLLGKPPREILNALASLLTHLHQKTSATNCARSQRLWHWRNRR